MSSDPPIERTSVEPSSRMKPTVIEIVTFKLAPGAADAQFIAANQRVETEYVMRQPGFVSRETARGSNGEWLVVVPWVSVADADASMASFATAPATTSFMAAIDGSSMVMRRYSIAP